jgi:hypothetical protein
MQTILKYKSKLFNHCKINSTGDTVIANTKP